MDYSKLSDFEINKSVAEVSSIDCCVRINFSGESIGGEARKWLCRYEEGTKFDPCNNPADAWPIIVDNSIGIKKQSNGLWVSSRHGGMYPQYHENPLRAAMIVFLMMQGSANVPANSTGSDIR
ncbi:phage protein NinX family protein [Citrobacter youngae]|uniref:phage protein NinX family protein n=1 Tax=Citrobacter youngae TaxID=133448 RepID=UPI00397D5988